MITISTIDLFLWCATFFISGFVLAIPFVSSVPDDEQEPPPEEDAE